MVERIRRDLKDAGLATDPPFETVPLDGVTTIVPQTKPDIRTPDEDDDVGGRELASHTVTIGTLAKGS